MSNIWHELKTKADELKFDDSSDKRNWIDEKFKEEMAKSAQDLVDNMNCMGCENIAAEGMFNGIINTHRQLQSDFWNSMMKVIKKYGETKFYDGRNEWAVKMCQRMSEAAEKF